VLSRGSTLAALLTGVISMKLISDLFSTDYGLMSISGIIFMLGMGVFFLRFFKRKMAEDEAAAAKANR
jgi:biotin transporter BioY